MFESKDNVKNEVTLLKKQVLDLTNSNKDLKDQIMALKTDMCVLDIRMNDLNNNLVEYSQKIVELKTSLEKKQNSVTFIWKIDKWSDKLTRARSGQEKYIYSDAFDSHKNGYNMCLCIFPNGYDDAQGTYLGVYVFLMQGKYDDMLPWPFKFDITFELISEGTNLIYKHATAKYEHDPTNPAFETPMELRSEFGEGFHKFYSLHNLSSGFDVCKNDRIYIRATVNRCK